MKRLIYILTFLFLSLTAMVATPEKLFLKPNSNWTQANARFAAYFFGNGEKWISMIKVANSDYYEVTVPAGYSKVIFCRMNPSASANNWDNKWNQTGDLTIPTDGKNLFTVPNDSWDGSTTTWSKALIGGANLYFVKPDDWTASTIQFFIGHGSHSIGYKMEQIIGTKFYYISTPLWNGYNGWSITNVEGDVWGKEDKNFLDRYMYTLKRTADTDAQVSSSYNLIDNLKVRSDNETSYDFDFNTSLSSYTSLNHNHIINVTTNNSASTAGGYVTASSYKLTEAAKADVSEGTTSGAKTTISVAYTALVTLKAKPNDGYGFLGWYDGNNLLSTSTDYDYTAPNSSKTITAKFTKCYVAGSINLCGGNTAWELSDQNAMIYSDGVFSKVYSLPKSAENEYYEFKVVYNNTWYGYDNVDTNNSMTCSSSGSDKNIRFSLSEDAKVFIAYNVSDGKITLKLIFPKGKTIYFSSKKTAERYAAYFYNESSNTWVDVNAPSQYANIYSLTVPAGEWIGVIFCGMKNDTNTNSWDNVAKEGSNNKQTADLRYEYKNWFVWGNDNDDAHDNDSYWRNFENLIFAGQKLYFKPDSNWEADGARFAAYYWDVVGENAWANCVYNEEGHVYEVVAPTQNDPNCAWINMKFVRMNPNTEENNFNDGVKWNETSNLTFDGENDFFLIKLMEKNDQGNWDWDTADPNNWIKFSNPFKDVIFFEPNQSLKDAESKRFSVYFWNGFGENCWVKMDRLSGYDTEYYYAVIPEGYYTGANICSMNPNTTENNWTEDGNGGYVNVQNQTNNLTYHSDKLLYQVPEPWGFKEPDDQYWVVMPINENAMEIKDGVANGAYYQPKKYTLEISGGDVTKWHWISLPYNVNVKDIKSNITAENPYGTDFIMKCYNTEARANWAGEKPTAEEDNNTWKELTKDDLLEAGRGYILGVNTEDKYVSSGITLTFPANGNFHVVTDQVDAENENIKAKSQELDINSNWHLIGTGLYGETGNRGGDNPVNYVAYPTESGSDYTYHCFVGNEWANLDPAFQERLGTVGNLEKYKAFFVQHSGEYSFSKVVEQQNMAPRRARAEEVVEQYYINIVGEKDTARTAIFLAEDGTDEYVVGKDFLHFGVTGQTAQLYTKLDSRLLAFNHLKRENRVVDLGGYMVNAGEYTISMMDNGEASVVLIDSYTGESVDLTVDNYTFTTEKGSLDGRFSIAISYAEKDLNTNVGNEMAGDLVVSNNGGLIVVDGLSVGADVWIFDAVGRCVDRFVADGERHELNIGTGVYVLKTSVESVKFVVW